MADQVVTFGADTQEVLRGFRRMNDASREAQRRMERDWGTTGSRMAKGLLGGIGTIVSGRGMLNFASQGMREYAKQSDMAAASQQRLSRAVNELKLGIGRDLQGALDSFNIAGFISKIEQMRQAAVNSIAGGMAPDVDAARRIEEAQSRQLRFARRWQDLADDLNAEQFGSQGTPEGDYHSAVARENTRWRRRKQEIADLVKEYRTLIQPSDRSILEQSVEATHQQYLQRFKDQRDATLARQKAAAERERQQEYDRLTQGRHIPSGLGGDPGLRKAVFGKGSVSIPLGPEQTNTTPQQRQTKATEKLTAVQERAIKVLEKYIEVHLRPRENSPLTVFGP